MINLLKWVGRLRLRAIGVGVLLISLAFVAVACSGDDDSSSSPDDAGESSTTPTATTTATATAGAADSMSCDLLGVADVEAVLGDIISIQEGIPDDFESCYAFAGGGEVILEICACLTDEEFDQEIVNRARGRGTVSEGVLMLGDKAAWVPAGDNQPNTGILWVKSGDTTLTLWLNVPVYKDAAVAQADTVSLMTQVLAGLP